MNKWYECRVKYLQIDQEGYERNVTETRLVEAVSYTDAESSIYEIMKEITRHDFHIVGIKQSNITEVIPGAGEFQYKAKVTTVSLDDNGKKIISYCLAAASDIIDAYGKFTELFSTQLTVFKLDSISETNIIETYNLLSSE